MASLSPAALQRLQRDLSELYKEPLPGIRVYVDPSNISHMCLILEPLEGSLHHSRLHLSVLIPSSYPHLPPKVSIDTPVVGHPNVFDSHICCDILRPQQTATPLYPQHSRYMGGYTPAYLLKYVFLQLLTFFSAPRIEQDYGGMSRTLFGLSSVSTNFLCKRCDYSRNPQSKVVYPVSYEPSNKETAHKNVQVAACPQEDVTCEQDLLHMLHDHVWLLIFERLLDQDLINLRKASPRVAGDVLCRYNVLLRNELVCFFTRKSFREALLGVGVRLDDGTTSSSSMRKRALHIDAFDLLSEEAFEAQHVRHGICGNGFTHFLPLGLDDQHFVRAVPILQKFLGSVKLILDISPTGFLDVIPKLMNTMIVKMMTDCDTQISGAKLDGDDDYMDCDLTETVSRRAILQASENAFKGYCLLFHLLVKLSGTFPVIKVKAQEKLTLSLPKGGPKQEDDT
ncbi:hypothetical protein L7F22_033341 [Adiantum nelumboides]|nr:hypothetical protein [Adiantum nelumboides]